jgi:sarcosine oxidase, subunit alpha
MEVLRIEKGHLVVGAEMDGRVTPMDLGFAGMLSTKKDFIGRRALARRAFGEPDRQALVGLRPADGKTAIPKGAQIVADANAPSPNASLGRVTSTHFSPTLDSPIALALVAGGLAREGETLFAVSPLTSEQAEVMVIKPMFVDPAGERLRG